MSLDCKTVGFFRICKEIGKACGKTRTFYVCMHAKRASLTRPTGEKKNRIFSVSPQSRSLFSALFQTFCLTARAYLNTQKYGLFCSLISHYTMLSKYGNCTHLLKIKTSRKSVVFTNKVGRNSRYFVDVLIKQLFHSRLLDIRWLLPTRRRHAPRWLSSISYPSALVE